MIMDRSLLFRAIAIGIACFIVAIAGLGLSVWLDLVKFESPTSLCAVGVVFMLFTGTVASLVFTRRKATAKVIFLASAIAGGTPVSLLMVLFWSLALISIVNSGGKFWGEPFNFGSVVFIGFIFGYMCLALGLGMMISAISGMVTWMLARRIVRLSG